MGSTMPSTDLWTSSLELPQRLFDDFSPLRSLASLKNALEGIIAHTGCFSLTQPLLFLQRICAFFLRHSQDSHDFSLPVLFRRLRKARPSLETFPVHGGVPPRFWRPRPGGLPPIHVLPPSPALHDPA